VPTPPPASVADFKAQFVRGFRYTTGADGVTDADISLGITLATSMFNPALWNDAERKAVFLLAAAHFVVVNIQAAGGLNPQIAGTPGGIADATENTGGGVIASKTVDKVSQTYAGLEEWCRRYPQLGDFLRTDFGAQYLALLKPRLVGRVTAVPNQQSVDAVVPNIPFLG
jgi:hypothetical protein